jgi:predicted metal-dependent hydrolase
MEVEKKLTQRTRNGIEHGLINTVANSVPDNQFKRFAEKDRVWLEKQKKEDEKLVYKRYLHADGEKEGAAIEWLQRPYYKYEGQPITTWRFIHDNCYWIPKGLCDEVNQQPALPKRSEILDANGVPTKEEGKAKKIHRFVSED